MSALGQNQTCAAHTFMSALANSGLADTTLSQRTAASEYCHFFIAPSLHRSDRNTARPKTAYAQVNRSFGNFEYAGDVRFAPKERTRAVQIGMSAKGQ
jgi:hypothetical protein